jgi:predicted trehalose synthase
VLVFDHRGLADSSDDFGFPATRALYAADVAVLLEHLAIDGAHCRGLPASVPAWVRSWPSAARPSRQAFSRRILEFLSSR